MKTFKITKNSQYIQSIQLDKGTYTYSCNVKSDATVLTIAFQNEKGVWTDFEIPILSGMWNKKAKLTFELKERAVNFDLCKYASNENRVYVQVPMLEEGTNASTPKSSDLDDLEQVEAEILQAKLDAENASKAYTDIKSEAERIIAEAYADGIVTNEEQARIDDVNAKLAAAKEYAEAQDALLKTQQEAYADGAISTAEQAAIDAAKDYADLKKTEVQAYADGIVSDEEARAIADALAKFNESKAHAETLVDGVEIGGRNLLLNTKSERSGAYNISPSYILTEKPIVGESYTLSGWFKFSEGKSKRIMAYNSGGSVSLFSWTNSAWVYGEWFYFSRTFTWKNKSGSHSANDTSVNIYGGASDGLLSYAKLIKLEKGNKPTDWTPAPEDTEAKINVEKQRINDIFNDNIADPSEKQYLSNLWQEIYAEYPRIWAQADTYEIDKATYVSKYNALKTILEPVLANLTVNTTVSGASVRTAFSQYYDSRTLLQNAIQNKINQNAQAAADEAKNEALDAQTTADTARSEVGNLNTYVDGAFKDGVISEAEAKAIEKYKNTINETMLKAEASYAVVWNNSFLSNPYKENLKDAKENLWDYQRDVLLPTIDTAIEDGETTAAEKDAVDSAFNIFNGLMSDFQTALEEANKAIQDSIYNLADSRIYDLEVDVIGEIDSRLAGVIAKANQAAAVTDKFSNISGGLTTGVLIELHEAEPDPEAPQPPTTAGLSGIQTDKDNVMPDNYMPAFWAGGTYEEAIGGTAKAIIRHDGFAKFKHGEIGSFNIVDDTLVSEYNRVESEGGSNYNVVGKLKLDGHSINILERATTEGYEGEYIYENELTYDYTGITFRTMRDDDLTGRIERSLSINSEGIFRDGQKIL